MYARILAILAAAGVPKVDWLLWNQGSADDGYADSYHVKWDAFTGQLCADGVVDGCTPFVTCETSPLTPNINVALQTIADSDPRCQMAKIGHLPTHDGVHFTGQSLVRAGWEAVYSLARTNTIFQAVTPVQDIKNGVYATGAGALTLPNGVPVRVPFSARYGDLRLITADGDFMAQVGGVYRVSVDAYAAGGRTKIKLNDRSNTWLATIGYSGNADPVSNTPQVHGEIVLNLAPGEKIKVYISQESGTDKIIQEAHSIAYNRLEVTYLGC